MFEINKGTISTASRNARETNTEIEWGDLIYAVEYCTQYLYSYRFKPPLSAPSLIPERLQMTKLDY